MMIVCMSTEMNFEQKILLQTICVSDYDDWDEEKWLDWLTDLWWKMVSDERLEDVVDRKNRMWWIADGGMNAARWVQSDVLFFVWSEFMRSCGSLEQKFIFKWDLQFS